MSTEVFVDELNRLYEFDIEKYIKECDDLKRMGYKIYRNSEGKHKVVAPPSKSDIKDMFPGGFGDIFGQIFGG